MRFDNRFSFISTYKSKIYAVKTGFEFQNTFLVGIGYNQLASSISRFELVPNGRIVDTVPSYLHLWYISAFGEYVFYRTKHWEFSVPIQLGFGYSKYSYKYNYETTTVKRHFIANYEANVNGYYKFFPGFGLGAGLGYQIMLVNNPAITENFNTPIYSFKIKIFLGDLYKLARGIPIK